MISIYQKKRKKIEADCTDDDPYCPLVATSFHPACLCARALHVCMRVCA